MHIGNRLRMLHLICHNDSPQLAEMFDLSPCYPVKEYGTEDFEVFFPPSTVAVGDVWALDPHRIVPFLCQFHPGARADLGNGAGGCLCVLTRMFIRLCGDHFPNTCRVYVRKRCTSGVATRKC